MNKLEIGQLIFTADDFGSRDYDEISEISTDFIGDRHYRTVKGHTYNTDTVFQVADLSDPKELKIAENYSKLVNRRAKTHILNLNLMSKALTNIKV